MADPATRNRQLPVTPPADHDSFAQGYFPPHTPHKVAQPIFGITINPNPNPGSQGSQRPQSQPQPRTAPPSPPQHQTQPQGQALPFPFPPVSGPVPHLYDQNGNPIDPRYVVMASRISAYYHQRCQAITQYQQQRYQQWAALQRRKCQDTVQAAMLVVAWYVRDRVRRRRRRQRRQFQHGLTHRAGPGNRPIKGERVRKWVLDVPSDVLSATGDAAAAGQKKPLDPEEARFQMDRPEQPDKDSQLYKVADDMIKSQIHKLDVPLMGVLSFDESESESESDSEEEEEEFDDEQEEDGGEDEEMDYEELTEDYEDDDGAANADKADDAKNELHERTGSQEVQVSSQRTSQKRTRSSSAS